MNTDPNILILGGYGNTGFLMARYLLQESHANIILAGRDGKKADSAAAKLNRQFRNERVRGMALDASSHPQLVSAMEDVSLLVAASSTAQYVETVARACLDKGADYFDVQYSGQKVERLRALSETVKSAGRCFITDGGFHPGLPAALIRYAAGRFDELQRARVGSVIKIDWKGLEIAESTAIEMAGEFKDYDAQFFQEGAWKKGFDTIKMDFGAPFGSQPCFPMMLEEMKGLPGKFPSLKDCGFFVGGFNWFTDMIAMPVMMGLVKVSPEGGLRPAGKFMLWSLKTFSRPPYETRLKLEAEGLRNGSPAKFEMMLSHPDGYVFTAIPAAATILQLIEGGIHQPGVFTQGEIVQPVRLLDDMERMGIKVEMGQ